MIKTLAYILGAILAIDALGFICWALSGQTPLDNAYIGTITAHVLRFILGI